MSHQDKLTFASEAWVNRAREILEDLAAKHGEPGKRFSLCEIFSDAPASISHNGEVAWHFRIDGREAEVAQGIAKDADVVIRADYEKTLPIARLVYTPEILAERAASRARNEDTSIVKGSRSDMPAYLVELHNRLAVITA